MHSQTHEKHVATNSAAFPWCPIILTIVATEIDQLLSEFRVGKQMIRLLWSHFFATLESAAGCTDALSCPCVQTTATHSTISCAVLHTMHACPTCCIRQFSTHGMGVQATGMQAMARSGVPACMYVRKTLYHHQEVQSKCLCTTVLCFTLTLLIKACHHKR